MTGRRALILGGGVAGLTCARLLSARGWSVDCVGGAKKPGPIVIVNDLSASLLVELWDADETLFAGAHCLEGRLTRWESSAALAYLTAPAFVIPIDVLVSRLADRVLAAGLRFVEQDDVQSENYDWIIHAGGRDTAFGKHIAFGHRKGIALSVMLTTSAPSDSAVVESVPGGWVIVIPQGKRRGTLQAVFSEHIIDPLEQLHSRLANSRFASTLVEEIADGPTSFVAMPGLSLTPCVPHSIAVGDAAIALDPMSGNGIGSGLRTAILASAVLDAAQRSKKPQVYFDHYTWRLHTAMRNHVNNCINFYGRAAYASSWCSEIHAMRTALPQIISPGLDGPAFKLNRDRLECVSGPIAAGFTRVS